MCVLKFLIFNRIRWYVILRIIVVPVSQYSVRYDTSICKKWVTAPESKFSILVLLYRYRYRKY
ncbi:hypothetical protein Hanom_Chr08g00753231 [Helianthus anomalus]